MKVVFFGTPDFAASVLTALMQSHHEVVAVVTQPDKYRGSGAGVTFSPVKAAAINGCVKVLQYNKVSKEGVCDLKQLNADIFVTAAFGQILSQEVLDIAPHGVINVHASLLPKYRGSAPIQWSVINGEKETGVTIMKTALSVDSGDIILQKSTQIGENETAGELFDRLSQIGSTALIEALDLIEYNKATFTKQDESLATHFPMFKREDGVINFNKTAREIKCFVLGVTPWPTAFTYLDGKMLKVFEVEVLESQGGVAGEVLRADAKGGIVVATADGAVRIKTLQAENGKRMSAEAYLLGHPIEVGKVLGR